MKIAFFGTGLMGAGFVCRLLGGGALDSAAAARMPI